jgi:hypothetical protein
MGFYRTVRLKLADRFPPLDSKTIYYKPPPTLDAYRVGDATRAGLIDKFLIGFAGTVVALLGLFIAGIGCFVLWALFAS